MNRILLADSNPILRSALALLLETRLDAQIIGQVGSMEDLLREAALSQPDIVIVGMNLPGEPTQDRFAVLRRITPHTNILLSSPHPEFANLTEGTTAFLCQANPPEIILEAIQSLLNCQTMTEVCLN